jgi:glycosyltransferase involved in cell wall biosynthesis
MGRDLVTRPYGRFFHLPLYLSRLGHDVTILLLDYRNGEPLDQQAYGMRWLSVPLRAYRPGMYTAKINALVRESRPDWLIGLSDTWFGILARHYGRRHGIRSCIDAYDNYESYIPWLKPLHWLWRSALRKADLVTAAGPGLLELMSAGRGGRPAVVVPMAADPIGFEPMDRQACRREMGLPADGRLIGYCGSIHPSRGVEVLFEAVERLRSSEPDIQLVVSGRVFRGVPLPPSVRMLGYIEDERMPVLLNCMDTLAVINRSSAFGHYSYPVKLYEAMRCGIPVVVTHTAATQWILAASPELLVPPDDPVALCEALARSLHVTAPVDYGAMPDWAASAGMFEAALLAGKPAVSAADTVSQ